MGVRDVISDMAHIIAVLVSAFTASFLFSKTGVHPVCYDATDNFGLVITPDKIEAHMIMWSIILAVPLMLIIFVDHNLNTEFLVDPNNKLTKGTAIHLDMFVVGAINCFLGFFGMPSLQGVFPGTPMHIRQMADIIMTSEGGVAVSRITRARDTRITQLMTGSLVALSIFLLPLPITYIPRAALDGLLISIAMICIKGNGTFSRLLLFIENQSAFPANHPVRKVNTWQIHKFTFLQLLQLGLACFLGFNNNTIVQIFFPVMIFLMIPIRHWITPLIIDPSDLELIDPIK